MPTLVLVVPCICDMACSSHSTLAGASHAGTGRDNVQCEEPSTAPREQLPSDNAVMWQTLVPLRAKIAELRLRMTEVQAQLVVAQLERDRRDRAAGSDSTGGAASLVAKAEQARAFWKLKQQEAADAEAEWKSLRLEADSVSNVERLQVAMNEAARELAAAHEDVLKFF